MSYAEEILPEFDQEMANTRKVLERIPDDKLDWRPHSKSNTIGWNANHLAEMPGWVEGTLAAPQWDINPEGGEPYQMPNLGSRQRCSQTACATSNTAMPGLPRSPAHCGKRQ